MTEINEQFQPEELITKLIKHVGDDPLREGLVETPTRVIKAWETWTSGYGKKPEDVLRTFIDGSEGYDALVFQGNIACFSNCEHHMVPFFGVVHIGYIPNGKVVGLSKLARLVEIFARRLQVQERLTVQVADALMEHLTPEGVGVVAQCRHLCLESRGIQKIGTVTTTSALRGSFKDQPDVRAEFMGMVHATQQVTVL